MLTVPPIRVLVVDDSILTRRVLAAALSSDPGITVVGSAGSGVDALAAVEDLQPDVVTLDVEMPGMNGLDVLQRLMERQPIPVIMVSYLTKAGADITVRAMMAGALDFVAKPGGPIMRDLANLRDDLVRKVRAAARSRPRLTRPRTLGQPTAPPRPTPTRPAPGHQSPNVAATPTSQPRPVVPARPAAARSQGERFERLVVIGASTGGPQALRTVVSDLVADRTTAYLLVQHMPAGMTSVLADMLDEVSDLAIVEASENDRLAPGTALIAPGDFHLRLGPGGTVHLDQGPKVHWVRPSVDVALLSAAELYGNRTVAAILTGIGSDGADGAAAIHVAGGTVFAEHESTSVVYGMPKAVAERGIASAVVPLPEMAQTINRAIAGQGAAPRRPRERARA